MTVRLSVVIVNWNTRSLLRGCLQSLERALGRCGSQILVVDNASSDGSVSMVQRDYPWVEVVANDRNLGFAAANNLALTRVNGSYVLFLNPDTEVTGDALGVMTSLLDGHPRVGLVGTTLLNPDGTLQVSCHRFYSFWHSLLHNRLVDKIAGSREMLDVHMADRPVAVDWMTGACLLARKSVLDEVGGFDSAFFVYGEEIDLQFRVRQGGWQVMYVPSRGVVHYGGQSAKHTPLAASLHDYRGRWLFLQKHYSRLSLYGYLLKTAIGLAFWTLYWGVASAARLHPRAGYQMRANGRLLAWHLTDRGTPPIPLMPPKHDGTWAECGNSGGGLGMRPVPVEEGKP